jgi:polyhydroxyalkanoate synthesis regulator phasin
MAILDMMRSAMLAGFGMQQTVREFIEDLVKKGDLSESKGARLVKEWTEKTDKTFGKFSNEISETFKKTMEIMNLPTREDIERLEGIIQALSARIERLEKAGSGEE